MGMFPRAYSKIVTSDSGVLREIPVNVTLIGANVKGSGYMFADSEENAHTATSRRHTSRQTLQVRR